MNTLIIRGNPNQYTFANSIVAANRKSEKLFKKSLSNIFVLHSNESQYKLNTETDWIDHLENNGIKRNVFTHKIIEIDETKESVKQFVDYIDFIIKGIPDNSNLLVDITNGTTVQKNLLSTTAYILDLPHQYMIDIAKLSKLTKIEGFISADYLEIAYVTVPDTIQLDDIAYLNLSEILRYKKIIDEHKNKYIAINPTGSDGSFFEGNISHSIKMKLQADRISDNTAYRISASSLSASLEDLIRLFVNKFIITEKSSDEDNTTFGQQLKILQSKIEKVASPEFDLKFFNMFNDFILYLRNSTVHKKGILNNIEKFKAELMVNMSFPFIEFYADIVRPILDHENQMNANTKLKRISTNDIKSNEIFYFGLDGDNTGSILESLFLSSVDEANFKKLSLSVSKAINKICEFIRKHYSKHAIVFAAGDDILFKGKYNIEFLHIIKQMYENITSGLTCSIGFGRTFKEVYLALKLAKTKPGKNSVVGIEPEYS